MGDVDTKGLLEHLKELECMLFEPTVRRNPDVVSSLLMHNFREFGSSGCVYSKAEIVSVLATQPAEPSVHLKAENFELVMIEPNAALLTYRVTNRTGGALAAAHTLRSSLWVLSGETWKMVFHQGTKIA